MLAVVIGLPILMLVVGFTAGFVTFRRSLRWCPTCGATLCCPEYARHRMVVP